MRTTSKSTTPVPPTELQARDAMTSYVSAHLAIEEIETYAKTQIEVIKKEAADEAVGYQGIVEMSASILMHYAEAHPEFFQERRKCEIYGGHKIGYHTDPPSTSLVKRPGDKKKQTWDGFMKAVKDAGERFAKFIRSKEEPDKDALLEYIRTAREASAKANDGTPLTLAESELLALGIKVVQEEKFVIELNLPKNTSPAQEVAA